MFAKPKIKIALALVLSASMLLTACTAQWISVALADLPVLTQMALNIASLVAMLQSGQQISAADAAAMQNISAEAGKDLLLLQTLYNQYKANPSDATLQKIQLVLAEIQQNLPALLRAAHISNPNLSARITAAVELILTTVQGFAALVPQSGRAVAQQRTVGGKLRNARQLKQQWNAEVCAPTGDAVLDAALAQSQIE
ncbi:MAG: hypothetical protein JST79_05200 [Acidobacteria bacterium]|nr:hypothetical protein [Acidobacteriota bacterium]